MAKPFKMIEGRIYESDNGRLICSRCAGMSARFTGRDISGQKIRLLNDAYAIAWKRETGYALECDGHCTVHEVEGA